MQGTGFRNMEFEVSLSYQGRNDLGSMGSVEGRLGGSAVERLPLAWVCLLYTSDAADDHCPV